MLYVFVIFYSLFSFLMVLIVFSVSRNVDFLFGRIVLLTVDGFRCHVQPFFVAQRGFGIDCGGNENLLQKKKCSNWRGLAGSGLWECSGVLRKEGGGYPIITSGFVLMVPLCPLSLERAGGNWSRPAREARWWK